MCLLFFNIIVKTYITHVFFFLSAIITIAIFSYLMFKLIRTSFFKALYRTNYVRTSNIFICIVQCWYVAISVLETISRFFILASLSFIYAGRFDCPFLAP